MFVSLVLVYTVWPPVDPSVKHNEPKRSFTRVAVNLETKLHLAASVGSSCEYNLHQDCLRMAKANCLYMYEVVYMLTVVILRPYAPVILLLRCQANFLAIRLGCAYLWKCVRRAAGCFLQCTGRPYLWWVCQSKCLRTSLLPAPCVGEQVERWQGWERRREREAQKKRVMQNAKQKEERLTPRNELQTWQMSCTGHI